MSLIEAIKEQVNLLDYVKSQLQLKKSGQHWEGLCPFHDEKTPSFKIKDGEQHFTCYGACGVRGDVINFVMLKEGWDTTTAMNYLADKYNIPRPERHDAKKYEKQYGLLKEAANYYQQALQSGDDSAHAREYLASRDISQDDIEKWHLGYARCGLIEHLKSLGYSLKNMDDVGLIKSKGLEAHERMLERIIYTILDARGRVVGFSGRTLGDDKRKYINTKTTALFKKSELLYGWHQAKNDIRDKKSAIVVEGFMDVIAAHRAGYTNVVAAMGKSFNQDQLKHLSALNCVMLAFDGDQAGRDGINSALDIISHSDADIQIVLLGDGVDVDDAISNDTWQQSLDAALSAPEYVIERTRQSAPEDASMNEKTKIAKSVLPLLMRLEDDIVRVTSVQDLARVLNINVRSLVAYAHNFTHKPAPISTRTKTQSKTPEQFILSYFISHPDYYFHADKKLRDLNEAPLEPSDFLDLHHEFQVFLDVMQLDTLADIFDYFEPADCAGISADSIWKSILDLRFKHLMRLVDIAISNKDMAAVLRLNKRKKTIYLEQKRGRT